MTIEELALELRSVYRETRDGAFMPWKDLARHVQERERLARVEAVNEFRTSLPAVGMTVEEIAEDYLLKFGLASQEAEDYLEYARYVHECQRLAVEEYIRSQEAGERREADVRSCAKT